MIYGRTTLQSFGRSILHPHHTLHVIFDFDSEDLTSLEESLLALTSGGFEELVTVRLFALSNTALEDCHSETCERIRAFFCGAEAPREELTYQLCLLHEKQADVKTAVRRCSQRSGVFVPSVLSCAASKQPLELVRNVTLEVTNALEGESEKSAVLALAAFGGLDDEAVDVDTPWEGVPTASAFRPFLPLAVLLDGVRVPAGQPLQQAVCATFESKPLACRGLRPVRFASHIGEALPVVPEALPVVTIHLNTQCGSNVRALDEVMRWVGNHEE